MQARLPASCAHSNHLIHSLRFLFLACKTRALTFLHGGSWSDTVCVLWYAGLASPRPVRLWAPALVMRVGGQRDSAHLSVGRGSGAEVCVEGPVCLCVWGEGGHSLPNRGKRTFMVRSKKQKCVPVSEKLVWDLISSKKDQSACGTD